MPFEIRWKEHTPAIKQSREVWEIGVCMCMHTVYLWRWGIGTTCTITNPHSPNKHTHLILSSPFSISWKGTSIRSTAHVKKLSRTIFMLFFFFVHFPHSNHYQALLVLSIWAARPLCKPPFFLPWAILGTPQLFFFFFFCPHLSPAYLPIFVTRDFVTWWWQGVFTVQTAVNKAISHFTILFHMPLLGTDHCNNCSFTIPSPADPSVNKTKSLLCWSLHSCRRRQTMNK